LDQKELVKLGAMATITGMTSLLTEILRDMPELRPFADGAFRGALIASNGNGKAPKVVRVATDMGRQDEGDDMAAVKKRSRPTMTAAQKKAVSKRMKAYWAARRAAEKKG